MNTYPREGVRVNSGGVYKGPDAVIHSKPREYRAARQHNGKVLAVGLGLVGVLVWCLTHLDELRAVVQTVLY